MCRARNQTAFKGSSWVFLSLLIFLFFFLLVLTLYLLFFSISSRLGFMFSLSLSLSLSPSLSFSLTSFCSSAPLPATLCLLIATRYPSHATSNSFCYTLSHTSPKLTLRALLFLSPLLSPPSVHPLVTLLRDQLDVCGVYLLSRWDSSCYRRQFLPHQP